MTSLPIRYTRARRRHSTAAILFAAVVALSTPALADGAVTFNERFPYSFTAEACGSEETVLLEGFVHAQERTGTGGGISHNGFNIHMALSGTGAESGDRYLLRDVFTMHMNVRSSEGQANATVIRVQRLVRQGAGDDWYFVSRFHVTRNALGEVTAFVSDGDFGCRG